MQVLLNAERHMGAGASMQGHLESAAKLALAKYEARIVRLDAHLSDANSTTKTNTDQIHCNLDARVVDIGVVVVEGRAATAHVAIQAALVKLDHALARALGKHDERRHAGPSNDDSADSSS